MPTGVFRPSSLRSAMMAFAACRPTACRSCLRRPIPEPVAEWIGHGECRFVAEGGSRRLVVDRIGQALIVREEPVAPAEVAALTPRERQVLEWVAEGKTNAEIARILVTSPGTVRKHLEHIYAKLGVHTRTAAAAFSRTRVAAAA